MSNTGKSDHNAVDEKQAGETFSARNILKRFGHLFSAQLVEAITNTGFILYLAWVDAHAYGEVMYALAAGSLIQHLVQFGTYFPLVRQLGDAGPERVPILLNRVNVIKILLLIPGMAIVWGWSLFRGFSFQMTWILFFICLGIGLETIAETFIAEMRVRGRQDREARIRMAGSILAYGFGFVAAAIGLPAMIIGMFRMVSGLIWLIFGARQWVRECVLNLFQGIQWRAVRLIFKAAAVFAFIEFLGNLYNKTNIFYLEAFTGVKGVAYYHATWNLVDAVSKLVSMHFLGAVIFPVLAVLWRRDREQTGRLVKANALWLLVIAFPIMFAMCAESELLIGLIYPDEYRDAVWMQQILAWTIVLSFENNLFAYVMMTTGAQKVLLLFAILATGLNLLFNSLLVEPMGLMGGCLVIVLTKLTMSVLNITYCQSRFKYFRLADLAFPGAAIGASGLLFFGLKPFITLHPALAVSLIAYVALVWKYGLKYMGAPPRKEVLTHTA